MSGYLAGMVAEFGIRLSVSDALDALIISEPEVRNYKGQVSSFWRGRSVCEAAVTISSKINVDELFSENPETVSKLGLERIEVSENELFAYIESENIYDRQKQEPVLDLMFRDDLGLAILFVGDEGGFSLASKGSGRQPASQVKPESVNYQGIDYVACDGSLDGP